VASMTSCLFPQFIDSPRVATSADVVRV
jgi:hypothetical protein